MALTRNRLIVAKAESSYGVDVTPDGTNAILCRELDVQPLEVEYAERELIRAYLGNSQRIPGKKMSRIKAKVELAGSGAAGTAPQYGPLLKACGMAEVVSNGVSVTYTPVSSSFSSSSIYVYPDGKRHKVLGARGTFDLEFEEDGIPYLNFDIIGIYNAPTDTAAPSPTYANQAVPKLFNADNTVSVSVHGYSPCIQMLKVSMGNELVYNERPGCTKQARITDRKPTGELMIESPTIAQKDFWTQAVNASLDSISLQHGPVGNRVTLTMPTASLDAPQYDDADGIEMLKIGFVPTPNTGNDEISLVFA